MKKTLITLFAMSSVAFGASNAEVNANLAQAIKDYNYQEGDAITLRATVALAGGSNAYFQFAEGWHLYSQEKQYFGVTTGGDPGSWNIPESGKATTETYTGGLNVESSKSWLWGPKGTNSVTITITSYAVESGEGMVQYLSGLRLETATGDVIMDSQLYDANGQLTTFFNLKEMVFNQNVSEALLQLRGNPTSIDLVNYVAPTPETPAIPEPATATLSLLALAGLAARRRRK